MIIVYGEWQITLHSCNKAKCLISKFFIKAQWV